MYINKILRMLRFDTHVLKLTDFDVILTLIYSQIPLVNLTVSIEQLNIAPVQ